MRERCVSIGAAILFVLLCGATVPRAVAAETASTLDIDGARTVSPEAIRAAIGPLPDGALPPEHADRAVKTLMAPDIFPMPASIDAAAAFSSRSSSTRSPPP